LIASAFTAAAFAQAQPADSKAQTGTETHKSQPAKPAKKQAKAQKKSHKTTAKANTKSDAKPEATK
jgi:hypothetical protein